jgi:hypothetical protein
LEESEPATIALPDQTTIEAAGGQFRQTTVPGIYTVNQGSIHWRFAVNLDPAETRTGPMVEDDLERLGIPLHTVSSLPAVQSNRHLREAEIEGRQKLWRWLVIGALVALGVESWLAGRLTRGRVEARIG